MFVINLVRKYEEKYPEFFKVIYREENTYHSPNRVKEITALKKQYLRGKYVAICEGDDYWTCSNKLQMQVDYMEEHYDCMMTVHNAQKLDFLKNEMQIMKPFSKSGIIDAEHIILQRNGIIPTASYVVRKDVYYLEEFFSETGIGDWPLQLNAITKGYVYYFDEPMSVYRYMHVGSWSKRTYANGKENEIHCLKMCVFLLKYNAYTKYKYDKWIVARQNRFIGTLVAIYRELGKKDYYDICKFFQGSVDEYSKAYISKINKLVEQVINLNFESRVVLEYCKRGKPLIVWGTGQYAEKCVKVLEQNKIDILGFLVTKKDEDKNTFMGKVVWDVDDFPYEFQNVNILIAVGIFAWSEVLLKLDDMGIKNYYSPFIIDIK